LSDPASPTLPPRTFRGTVAGDGRPGPIEERIGRRLVRLLDPESDEGLQLLDDGLVELVGPEGDSLGQVRLREAYRKLRERLERQLADEENPPRRGELQEGLDRLSVWSTRLSAEPREPST
jgi:hypothetical protein